MKENPRYLPCHEFKQTTELEHLKTQQGSEFPR